MKQINTQMPKFDSSYYNRVPSNRDILDRYSSEDGDWDDIISPDDYDAILERKQYWRSMASYAWR